MTFQPSIKFIFTTEASIPVPDPRKHLKKKLRQEQVSEGNSVSLTLTYSNSYFENVSELGIHSIFMVIYFVQSTQIIQVYTDAKK